MRNGLTSTEAAERLRRDGPNTLPGPRRPTVLVLLTREFVHFFALLLWCAAALAVIGGMPELATAIVVVILVNGGFAFAQEYRADRAGRRLRRMLPETATALRDGRWRPITITDLVVGDTVSLKAGDRVAADIRIEEAHGLAVDEALLTGESTAAHPTEGDTAHAGTHVVEGEATGSVVATGKRTRIGRIAELSSGARRPVSPLTLRLRRVVAFIAAMAAGVGVAFFAISVSLGTDPAAGFLLSVGVTVALVPEGLLPTVTLSLAQAAQRMAHSHALVRHLEAVETLGSATLICTDKTGTLTRNEMSAVEVWTPAGTVHVTGAGYEPQARLSGGGDALVAARALARTAALSSGGGVQRVADRLHPTGDPIEVALHVLAARVDAETEDTVVRRFPFDPRRRRSSVVTADAVHVKGAPDSVLPLCHDTRAAEDALADMTARGLRVLAVAGRAATHPPRNAEEAEDALVLAGLVGLEDPPREGVGEAIERCRMAGIRIVMITGDHPDTAVAIAREVGLVRDDPLVMTGRSLPSQHAALGELLDRDEVVIARVTPEDKLRIAAALQRRGHVVAMTGDGVNDGPALRRADIGVAMGASGTDVAREAADLVLLDDHFTTIVTAIELGRATFGNIRRFLTYHLVDNVAELVPFLAWAVTGGQFPLALGVLQILALDIGTDLLPALALGAEPPTSRTLREGPPTGALVDRRIGARAFGVLGPVEAGTTLLAFTVVLWSGGWSWGRQPSPELLAAASGTAFATVVLGQMTTAFACRSETVWIGGTAWRSNPLLVGAVVTELAAMWLFLTVAPLPRLLGGTVPPPLGWAAAGCVVPAIVLADLAHKAWRSSRPARRPGPP